MIRLLNIFLVLGLMMIDIASAREQNVSKKTKNTNINNQNFDELTSKKFKDLDSDSNNCISYEEFKAFFKRKTQNNKSKSTQSSDIVDKQ